MAPRILHPSILKEKTSSCPRLDLTLLSKEDLLSLLVPPTDFRAVLETSRYLSLPFSLAEEILSYLPYARLAFGPVPDFLSKLLAHLESEGHLRQCPLRRVSFSPLEVLVIAYSKLDFELSKLLALVCPSPRYFDEARQGECPATVFPDPKTEVLHFFEDAAFRLSSGGTREILLVADPTSYLPLLHRLARRYGIPVSGLEDVRLSDLPLYRRFLEISEAANGLPEAFDLLRREVHDDPYGGLMAIKDIAVRVSFLPSPSPEFRAAFAYLSERKRLEKPFKGGIRLVPFSSALAYLPNVYVLGMNEGSYPPAFKDDGLLSDREKKAMGLNASVDLTFVFQDQIRLLLHSKNHPWISYPERDGPLKLFPSPLIGEKAVTSETISKFHSEKEARFLSSYAADAYRVYGEKRPERLFYRPSDLGYRDYSHAFDAKHLDIDPSLSLSYSKVNSFVHCPFSYFASRVLDAAFDDSSPASHFGTVFHFALQLAKGQELDLNALHQKILEEYEENPVDGFLAEARIEILAPAVLRGNEEYLAISSLNDDSRREMGFEIEIDDVTSLRGQVDKILVDEKDKSLAVVDYKTSSFKFSLEKALAGYQLQLPLYLLYIEKACPEYRPIALFIQNIADTTVPVGNPIPLDGIYLDDEKVFSILDPSLKPGDSSSFVKGLKMNKDGTYRKGKKRLAETDFLALRKAAESRLGEVGRLIREGHFPIAPVRLSGERLPCEFCEARDICYRDESDIVEVKLGGDDEEEEKDE